MKAVYLVFVPATFMGAEAGLASGPPIDVTQHIFSSASPAYGDAVWGLTDCTVPTTGTITCPAPAVFALEAGHPAVLIADDAGTSGFGTMGTRQPLVTIINTATLSGTTLVITVGTAPTFPTANVLHLVAVQQTSMGSGYEFGSTQTLVCGGCSSTDGHVDAVGIPGIMTAVDATIISGGSTTIHSEVCSLLTATSQTGLAGNTTHFDGYVNASGTLTSIGIFSGQGGSITADSSTPSSGVYDDTMSGACFPAGTTPPVIGVSYGVVSERIEPGTGIYVGTGTGGNKAPCYGTPVAMNSGTVTGSSGLMVECGSGSLVSEAPYVVKGGTVSFGTDNTAALQAAIATGTGSANALAAEGQPQCLYFPAGNYITYPLNTAVTPTTFVGYGCLIGDEHLNSNVFVVPNTAGDVFAWADSNANSSIPDLGYTSTFQAFASGSTGAANQAGASFRNITITGDRLSTQYQNALVFYGQTQFAYLDNFSVYYMNGHGFLGGAPDSTSNGTFAESVVQNGRFEFDGSNSAVPGSSVPDDAAFEITSYGSLEGPNDLYLTNLRFYQSFGPSLWIHQSSSTAGSGPEAMWIVNARFEGSRISSTTAGGDMLEIGDPGGGVHAGLGATDILGRNIDIVNPTIGYAAVHVAGDSNTDTGGIDITGEINAVSTEYGRGLQVEACDLCTFKFAKNSSVDFNVMVGGALTNDACSGAHINASGIIYDGIGAEPSLTTCIDPAATGLVNYPVRQPITNAATSTPGATPLSDLTANVTATTGTVLTMGATGLVPIQQHEPTWNIVRSGPTSAVSDQWDTGSAIVGALPNAVVGQFYRLRVCNQSAVSDTIAPQAGSNVTGTVTVPSGVCVPIIMTITNTSGPMTDGVAFAPG